MNKNAELPAWSYVIGLIISLLVIMLIIYITLKAKGSILELVRFF